MEVNRSRFLLLTASLAVSACNSKTETKSDAKAKDAPAANEKAPGAAKDASAADKQDPEPPAKEFGVKGAPEPDPEGDALPPIEPEPEEAPAPSPIKE
jgi:hypothetical protein